MAVTVYVLAQPTQRAIVPARAMTSAKAAWSWKERTRETWRGALHEGEVAFSVLVLDEDGLPLKCWEHPREGFGDDGIETGRATLRQMKAQAAE